MSQIMRLTLSVSRRLRLAALTFTGLFAVKIALAAFSGAEPVTASTAIVSGDRNPVQSETLEQME